MPSNRAVNKIRDFSSGILKQFVKVWISELNMMRCDTLLPLGDHGFGPRHHFALAALGFNFRFG